MMMDSYTCPMGPCIRCYWWIKVYGTPIGWALFKFEGGMELTLVFGDSYVSLLFFCLFMGEMMRIDVVTVNISTVSLIPPDNIQNVTHSSDTEGGKRKRKCRIFARNLHFRYRSYVPRAWDCVTLVSFF